ncbi:hypothetical protein [Clostridium sp.]|uniref:hypothetical protein n=1 Tax=Clostridium sp. TaxID=1506 RepID=UPI003F3035EE
MIVKAITVPTPRRIKKFLKEKLTKERVCVYSLIGAGVGLTSLTDVPAKGVITGALVYCGIAYEVIEKSEDIINDPFFKEVMVTNPYIGYGVPLRIF